VIGEDHPGLFISGDLDSLYNTFIHMLSNPSMQQEALKIQAVKLNEFDMENYFQSHHALYDMKQ
jgi:hypothetical protein